MQYSMHFIGRSPRSFTPIRPNPVCVVHSHSEEKSLLERVIETPEEHVETFAEAISDAIQTTDKNEEALEKIRSGKPDQITTPVFSTIKEGVIMIEHGWDDSDYVWHIQSHPKRPFKVTEFKLLYAIAQVMNPMIPDNIEVKIWRPYADWEIQEYTFKAMGLKEAWQFDSSQIKKTNEKLCEVLNSLT